MTRCLYFLLVLLLLCACAGPTAAPAAAPTATPTSTPANTHALSDTIEAVWDAEYPSVSAIAIRHNDALVYEAYRGTHSAESHVEIFSITKSITSLLVGIALYNGDLDNIDTPVAAFLPTYMANADERLQSMTVAHLLTMRSGLTAGPHLEGRSINSYRGDLHALALDLGFQDTPGERAIYSTLASNLLGGVLEAATDQDLESYAATHLFEPLGIQTWQWYRDDTGRVTTGAGLRMSTADVATVGQLVLNDGVWGGRRLISAEYLQKTTSKQATMGFTNVPNAGYGYLWWVFDDRPDQQSIVGVGYAGQFLYILPEHHLSIAVSSPCCSGNLATLRLIRNTIVPAVLDSAGATASEAEHAACAETTGLVETRTLVDDVYGDVPLNVYMPPCYTARSGNYPVLYMLHGGGLNHKTWFQIGAPETANRLISGGAIEPMLLVSPAIPNFADSSAYATLLIEKLMPEIDATYGVPTDCHKRGLMGMSLGGGLTASLGLQHPEQFDALGILSVAQLQRDANVIDGWLGQLSAETTPAIYLDIGDSDGLLKQQQDLHEQLVAHDIPHHYSVRSGDHSLGYWSQHLDDYLLWFDQSFRAEAGCRR